MMEHRPITKTEIQCSSQSELATLINGRVFLRERVKEQIRFANPIIKRENHGIVYSNTINVLQGKAGSHKSRLMEILCSCILSTKISEDYIGFEKFEFSSNFTLLYVDTERNTKDQFPFALQKIIRKAGFFLDNQPENFDFISMIEIARESRLEILQLYIEQLRETNDGHIIIVLEPVVHLENKRKKVVH